MKASRASRTVMLLALTCGFALSQAYRTVATLMAPQLQTDFAASPQALGVFAGAFHFAFGALQIFVGVGIDLQGIRRTVLPPFHSPSPAPCWPLQLNASSCWCLLKR